MWIGKCDGHYVDFKLKVIFLFPLHSKKNIKIHRNKDK